MRRVKRRILQRANLKWIIVAASLISLSLAILFIMIFPWSEMKKESFESEVWSSGVIVFTIIVINLISIFSILFDTKKDMIETECLEKTLYLINEVDGLVKNQENYLKNMNEKEFFTNEEYAYLQEICTLRKTIDSDFFKVIIDDTIVTNTE